MMRSLYVRIVGIFLMAVIIGLIAASFFTIKLFKSDITSQMQKEMTKAGNEIIQLCQNTSPDKLDAYLSTLSKINPYQIRLYDEKGFLKKYGSSKEIGLLTIQSETINRVLHNETYFNDKNFIREPEEMVVGLPIKLEGKSYALFLQPLLQEQLSKFQDSIQNVLLLMLAIGSLLFIFATRFIVKPIKEMTRATQKMALGDFDVQLTTRRKDELGILAESFTHMSKELKQIEQMRKDFVSNVSHEIQSPLTSIQGFTKALKNEQISPEERMRYLTIIEKESERLSRLGRNLLQLASLESEHHPFHRKKYRLDEQIRRVVVAAEPQWSRKNLTLSLNLPRLEIVADEDQLNQVFSNLLFNSIKFTPDGGEICFAGWENGHHIHIKISDTGIGILKEEQEKIFQRFYKSDKSRNRSLSGSGLGLSIVQKIMDIHKGTIQLQSDIGKGTTFLLSFPKEE